MRPGVVIVGGGLAAQRCSETLRANGYEGRIRVIGDEPRPPYDRPPLSKAVLAGARDADSIGFRPPAWYDEHDVELRLDERAVALDPGIRAVTLASGEIVGYDELVIATGSRPRELPGAQRFVNAHTLRTVDDSLRLHDALAPGSRLIVVGAGFIGLEVAATARGLGVEVTVLEAAPAPLTRVLGPRLGNWFADMHRAEGVEVLLSAHVARFGEGAGGHAEWVQLTDGARLECDALVIGIGIQPNTEWLEGSGLETEGVPVDPLGRTEAPHGGAAGDSARVYNPERDEHERSEHWEAAARQGVQVARTILGLEPARAVLPSFWTDQYGLRIQLVGDSRDADEIEIDGDPHQRDFSALMLRDGHPAAALVVGRPRALPELRRRVEAHRKDEERTPA